MLRSASALMILLAAVQSARPADELKALEGTWLVTRALDGSRDGLFDGPLDGALFIVKNKRLVVVTVDNKPSGGPCTAAEGGKEGRHLDFTFNGVKVMGASRLAGKTASLCFDRTSKTRRDRARSAPARTGRTWCCCGWKRRRTWEAANESGPARSRTGC